jgi:hypothetical protein
VNHAACRLSAWRHSGGPWGRDGSRADPSPSGITAGAGDTPNPELRHSDHTTAILWAGLTSLFTVLGGLLTLLAAQLFLDKVPYLLALGAAVFLYMALADLVPRHRREIDLREALMQSVAVILGAALVFGLSR